MILLNAFQTTNFRNLLHIIFEPKHIILSPRLWTIVFIIIIILFTEKSFGVAKRMFISYRVHL